MNTIVGEFVSCNWRHSLDSVIVELCVVLLDIVDVLGELFDKMVCVTRFLSFLFFLHLFLDLLHDILHVKWDLNRFRHLISIFYAHTQKILHLIKFDFVCFGDFAISIFILRVDFVDELDDGTWLVRVLWAKNWTYHEIANICTDTLIVNLLNKFGLLGSIIWNLKLLGLENEAGYSRVCWEVHEFFRVDCSDAFSFLFFGQVLFFVIIDGLLIFRLLFLVGWEVRGQWLVFTLLSIFFIAIGVIWAVFFLFFFILGGIRICEEVLLVLIRIIHEHTNSLKPKETWQAFSHLPEESLMMPLCTNLTGQLKGIDNLLFSLFDFF